MPEASARVPPLRYHPRFWGLALAVVVALTILLAAIGAFVGWIGWSWYVAVVPFSPGRFLWALVGTALAWVWLTPVVSREGRMKGIPLTKQNAPELYAALGPALRAAGIPGPPQLDLTADASLSLAPPESLPQALLGQPRTIHVGMALINEVTADELVSLIAATAAGWGARGDYLGGWVTRTIQGLEGLGGTLGASGCLQMLNPLYWLAAGLSQLIQRPALLKDFAWQRPLYADASGVAACGSVVYSSAREKMALNEAIFETTAYNVVFDLMEQGKQLRNLFSYYLESKAKIEPVNLSMLREAVFSDDGGGTLLLPTLSQRLARVLHLPFKDSTDERPARELLADAGALEIQLTKALTTGLDQALASARQELWDESQMEIQIMKDEYENRN